MKRLALAKLVRQVLKKDDLVVCGLGATEAAFKEAGPVGPTYFASDPMGLWPSIALGLALAQPKRRVTLLAGEDRKSTRLNSSHSQISYAVFCLKKKNTKDRGHTRARTI